MMAALPVLDYRRMPEADLAVVIECTARIRALLKQTTASIVEIGQRLMQVRRVLSRPGQFPAWLEAEFGWSRDTAERFMHVAERFGANPQIADFDKSALYILSAPSTSKEAVQECLDRASRGERITHAAAQETVERHRTLDEALANLPPEKREHIKRKAQEQAEHRAQEQRRHTRDAAARRIERALHHLRQAHQLISGLGEGPANRVLKRIDRAIQAAEQLET